MAKKVTIAVIVRFTFEGNHYWPGAPENSQEYYLRFPHRHLFHVEAKKVVSQADRDIEFIGLAREMREYSERQYSRLHTMSCETMAIGLLDYFHLASCEVNEDGENGAIVTMDELHG